MKRIMCVTLALALVTLVLGCEKGEKYTPAENAAKGASKGLKAAGKAVDDAGRATGNAVKDAGKATGNAVSDAVTE